MHRISGTKIIKALKEAGKRIEKRYFEVEYVCDEKGNVDHVFRERVYCYELYHQLRLILGDLNSYVINGELDKAGHGKIKKSYKPDFLIHKPGIMKNLAIIEVKPITSDTSSIKEDIDKIIEFVEEYNYQLGILLIFGSSITNKIDDIKNTFLRKIKEKELDGRKYIIMHHARWREEMKIYIL